jgi:hypothetical protein
MFENDFENLGIGSYSIDGFQNEILKTKWDEHPGVGGKFGFIRKTLVFLCSVRNN